MRDDLPLSVTLEVRDRCLCVHVQRAARAIARRFDEALRSCGLTNGQFSLLMALNRPAPPRIGDLAPFLAMDRTTLMANRKPLQRRGLVEAFVDPNDKRSNAANTEPPDVAAMGRQSRCKGRRRSEAHCHDLYPWPALMTRSVSALNEERRHPCRLDRRHLGGRLLGGVRAGWKPAVQPASMPALRNRAARGPVLVSGRWYDHRQSVGDVTASIQSRGKASRQPS